MTQLNTRQVFLIAIAIGLAGLAGVLHLALYEPHCDCSPGEFAVRSIESIQRAQGQFHDSQKRYATLKELGQAKLIGPVLATGEKQGYRYSLSVTKDAYSLSAEPKRKGPERPHFWSSDKGPIHFSDGPANSESPVLPERVKTAKK